MPRSAAKPVAHGRWRAADRVCDATVGGGTETTGRRTRKRRARESVQARTCRFPIFDDIAPAPRSRETPCLARCGAHAPADVRTMWAAVVPSWSNLERSHSMAVGFLISHRHLQVKDFRAPRCSAPPRTRQSAPHTRELQKNTFALQLARVPPHTDTHTHSLFGSSRPTPLLRFQSRERALENANAR